MTKKFREFPEIEIPAFLQDWVDTSWHNDALASCEYPRPTAKGHELICWVNYAQPEEREPGCDSLYIVELRDEETGDEIRSIPANTHQEALQAIQQLLEE